MAPLPPSGAPATPISPLTLESMGRLKTAKIFKDAVEQPTSSTGRSSAPLRHITALSFDDRGDTIITASEDETFRLYNCKTGKHLKTLYSKKYGVDIPRFTHKNTTIVYASTKEDDTIRYHSLHDNKYLQYFKGHKKRVVSLEVSPLEDGFMSGSLDNTVRLWDLRTPSCRGILNLPASPLVAYDCSGIVFAVGLNHYSRILLYDMSNYDKDPFLTIHLDDPTLARITFPPRIPVMTTLSFSTNGKWLLVGTSGDQHYIMDAFDGKLLAKLVGHEGLEQARSGGGVTPVKGMSGEEVGWTPDSKFVVGGSLNGKIHIWDIAGQTLIPALPGQDPMIINSVVILDGHPGPSRCVKFNPRLAMMVTAGTELAFWLPDPNPDSEEKRKT